MNKLAESWSVRYSLSETSLNRDLLVMLWDECNAELPDNNRLKEISQQLLKASVVTVMQDSFYFPEPSPKEMEEYMLLFRYPFNYLKMGDTSCPPIEPRTLELSVSVVSDDDEVLKLQPGVQLSLLDLEGV